MEIRGLSQHVRVARKFRGRLRPCALRCIEIAAALLQRREPQPAVGMLHLRHSHKLLLQAHGEIQFAQLLRLAHQFRQHGCVVRRRERGVGKHLERCLFVTHELQRAPERDGLDVIVRLRLPPRLKNAAHPRQPRVALAVQQQFVEPRKARPLIAGLVRTAQHQRCRLVVLADLLQHAQQRCRCLTPARRRCPCEHISPGRCRLRHLAGTLLRKREIGERVHAAGIRLHEFRKNFQRIRVIAALQFDLRNLAQVAVTACGIQHREFAQIRDRVRTLAIRCRVPREKFQRRGILRLHVSGLRRKGHGARLVAIPRLPPRNAKPARRRLRIIGLAHQVADVSLDERRRGLSLLTPHSLGRSPGTDALEKFPIHLEPLGIAAARRVRPHIRGLRSIALREHRTQFAEQQQRLARIRRETHRGLRLGDCHGQFAVALEMLGGEQSSARLLRRSIAAARKPCQHSTPLLIFPLGKMELCEGKNRILRTRLSIRTQVPLDGIQHPRFLKKAERRGTQHFVTAMRSEHRLDPSPRCHAVFEAQVEPRTLEDEVGVFRLCGDHLVELRSSSVELIHLRQEPREPQGVLCISRHESCHLFQPHLLLCRIPDTVVPFHELQIAAEIARIRLHLCEPFFFQRILRVRALRKTDDLPEQFGAQPVPRRGSAHRAFERQHRIVRTPGSGMNRGHLLQRLRTLGRLGVRGKKLQMAECQFRLSRIRTRLRKATAHLEILRRERDHPLPSLRCLRRIACGAPCGAELHQRILRACVVLRENCERLLEKRSRFAGPRAIIFHPAQREQWQRARGVRLCRALECSARIAVASRLSQQQAGNHAPGKILRLCVCREQFLRRAAVERAIPQPVECDALGGIRREHLPVAFRDAGRKRLRLRESGGKHCCGKHAADSHRITIPGASENTTPPPAQRS